MVARPDLDDLLFKAADKLRGNMDAAAYKHVLVGLLFLRGLQARTQNEARRTAGAFSKSGTRSARRSRIGVGAGSLGVLGQPQRLVGLLAIGGGGGAR